MHFPLHYQLWICKSNRNRTAINYLATQSRAGRKSIKTCNGKWPNLCKGTCWHTYSSKSKFHFFPFIKDYLIKDHRFSIMQGKILVMGMHTNIYQFQLCFSFNFVIEPHITFFWFFEKLYAFQISINFFVFSCKEV